MKTIRRWLELPFQLLEVLRSIDDRLRTIEGCVDTTYKYERSRKFLRTGDQAEW